MLSHFNRFVYSAMHVSVVILFLIGFIHIASAVPYEEHSIFLLSYSIWILVLCGILGVLYFVDIGNCKFFIYPTYLLTIFLLVVVLFYGSTVKGGQRWLDLGVLKFQPSEIIKLVIIFVIAHYCDAFMPKREYVLIDIFGLLNVFRTIILFMLGVYMCMCYKLLKYYCLLLLLFFVLFCIKKKKKKTFISIVDFVILPVYLIYLQPDFATALIVLFISTTIIVCAGINKQSIILFMSYFLTVVFFSWIYFFQDYQRLRIYDFITLNFENNHLNYQIEQSISAIGTGQLFGSGFGEGLQIYLLYLPENFTDFAFSGISGEWGLFGDIIILFFYSVLIISLVYFSSQVRNKFDQLVIVGFSSLIFWNMCVNIGTTIGMFPTAGVPLPFISSGGTSMFIHIVGFSICCNLLKKKSNFIF
ncbi:MAG: FtsW/RodA/SpoVE family cell cycle protein [Deltaproteobacteria bacterium]|nr:MAG: FtsW/RodA/SpoVE family cell cycle protein [Deltaproteobacteria bacterium]